MANFDLEKTSELAKLFEVKERDAWWRERFFETIPEASLRASVPQISSGPDGFPYFNLIMPVAGESFESYSLSHVLDHCVQNGVGMAIFSTPEKVEWVFSYGDLWSFKARGKFQVPAAAMKSGSETLKEDLQIMVAQPNEQRLPSYVRDHLRGFWKAVLPEKEIKIVLMLENNGAESLVFNIKPSDFPSEKEMQTALHYSRWFLPNDLAVVSLGETKSLDDHYQPL